MFDYCIWRRDEHYSECEEFADEWDAAVEAASAEAGDDVCKKYHAEDGTCLFTKVGVALEEDGKKFTKFHKAKNSYNWRPRWGSVYNYPKMRNDLNDGEFESDKCVAYYDYLEEFSEPTETVDSY